MNIRPRYALAALVHQYLRPVLVVCYGATMAGTMAAGLEVAQGKGWTDAAFTGLLVACIAGVLLSVLALWGIRYPAKVAPPPPPAPKVEPPAPAPVDDYSDLSDIQRPQSYEATMQRRHPAPWCRISEPQLARVIELYLDKGGSINVETYVNRAKICSRRELALLRTDLINHGLADAWNGTAVPHARGRAALEALLPRLDRGRG